MGGIESESAGPLVNCNEPHGVLGSYLMGTDVGYFQMEWVAVLAPQMSMAVFVPALICTDRLAWTVNYWRQHHESWLVIGC